MFMKRFIRDVLIFGILVLALLVAAETYVRNMPNPARDKHQWMLQHAPQVETLVLGSSHTFYGINPDVLGDNAYSLAMVSQTYRYDDWLLKNYDFKNLKRVILPFSYFSLYEDFESGMDEHYISRYRIYMDCPIHSCFSKYNFEFMSFMAFKEKLKSMFQPQHMTWTEKGWGSNYTLASRDDDWDNGEERALSNTYADTSVVPINRAFLRDIFEWCAAHDVAVYWISTPLTESYRIHCDSAQLRQNIRVRNELLSSYPAVHYYDFSADTTFVSEDFYDADHLSDVGARKLTRKLGELMR